MTAEPEPAIADPEKQLAWEKRHRPRAAIASILGAVGLLVFYVAPAGAAARHAEGRAGSRRSCARRSPATWARCRRCRPRSSSTWTPRPCSCSLIGIGGFVGWIGVAWAVGLPRRRHPRALARVPAFIIYVPIVGGVVLGVSVLMSQVGSLQVVSEFLDVRRTVKAATDADNGADRLRPAALQLGTLVLAVGLVLVSLNAMRVGLLTRMLGYIGIASGAMMVLFPLPIVQIFWLGALGFVLLGRWPGGDLPAWANGRGRAVADARASAAPQRRGAGTRAGSGALGRPRPRGASARSAASAVVVSASRRCRAPSGARAAHRAALAARRAATRRRRGLKTERPVAPSRARRRRRRSRRSAAPRRRLRRCASRRCPGRARARRRAITPSSSTSLVDRPSRSADTPHGEREAEQHAGGSASRLSGIPNSTREHRQQFVGRRRPGAGRRSWRRGR